MTTIHIDARELSGLPADAPVSPEAMFSFSPYTVIHVEDGDDYILTQNELEIMTEDGEATFDLPPTDLGSAMKVRENKFSGAQVKYVLIPASGTVEYGDLVEVDPDTLDPVVVPEAAWWGALNFMVVDADIVGDDLVFERQNGNTFNVGEVVGPTGPTGPTGATGAGYDANKMPLTPYDHGALAPTLANDNSTPLADLWADAAATGRPIYLPPGDWVTTAGGLPLYSGMVLYGAGNGKTTLYQTAGATALFSWNVEVTGVEISNMKIVASSSGVHMFAPGANGGISLSTFRNLHLVHEETNGRIWYQDNDQFFKNISFKNVEMTRAASATVTPFYLRSSVSEAMRDNHFDTLKLNGQSNSSTPFMEILLTAAVDYSYGWAFTNVIGIKNNGGLIWMDAPNGATFINCRDYDAVSAYTDDIFRMQAGANAAPINTTFINCGRTNQTMTSGKYDIFIDDSSTDVSLLACNGPAGVGAAIHAPVQTNLEGTNTKTQAVVNKTGTAEEPAFFFYCAQRTLRAGENYIINLLGMVSSTATLDVRVRCGPNGDATDALLCKFDTTSAPVANARFWADIMVSILTEGAAGTATAGGIVQLRTSRVGGETVAFAAGVVDTTIDNFITVTIAQSAAQTFTARSASLRRAG